jgi:dipeptidyl aminopeptidase/acylaminoacyl peptidase
MTSPRRFDQDLPALVADLYLAGMPDYRDDLVQRVARTRQRPRWSFPGRWLPMDIATTRVPATRLPWRQLGVLALIAILLAAMLAVYVGTRQPKLPPPFGVARNGAMLYGSGGDIYRLDPATGVSTALVTGPETDQIPMYSRDGTRFAFFRRSGTGPTTYQVVVANGDGTGQRVVSTDPVTFDYSINWSADGRSIILDDIHGHVTRLDTVGNAPPEKMSYPKVADIIALRPPDEAELLYRTVTADGWSLQIMDTDGTHARPVFPSGGTSLRDDDYSGYQWSPDGSKIAFRMHPDASDDFRIYIVNADGSGLHRLTHETGTECECDMFWSPDSAHIAFNRWRFDESTAEWHARPVGIVSVDDGVVRDIGPQPTDEGAEFAFSPDGASITWLPRRSPDSIGTTKDEPLLLDIAGGTSRRISVPVDSPPDWQRLASD